eukprot:14833-Heterococcus_DN1.PRE.2
MSHAVNCAYALRPSRYMVLMSWYDYSMQHLFAISNKNHCTYPSLACTSSLTIAMTATVHANKQQQSMATTEYDIMVV